MYTPSKRKARSSKSLIVKGPAHWDPAHATKKAGPFDEANKYPGNDVLAKTAKRKAGSGKEQASTPSWQNDKNGEKEDGRTGQDSISSSILISFFHHQFKLTFLGLFETAIIPSNLKQYSAIRPHPKARTPPARAAHPRRAGVADRDCISYSAAWRKKRAQRSEDGCEPGSPSSETLFVVQTYAGSII